MIPRLHLRLLESGARKKIAKEGWVMSGVGKERRRE